MTIISKVPGVGLGTEESYIKYFNEGRNLCCYLLWPSWLVRLEPYPTCVAFIFAFSHECFLIQEIL